MKGSIVSEGDVSVGQSGAFEGDIRAKRVLVSGSFDGTVDADRLEIVSTGQVTGDITVGELVIESGGRFSGASHIKGAAYPAPDASDAKNGTEETTAENGTHTTAE